VSSEGAPRKIEGMKSMKVWVIAIEITNTIKVLTGVVWVRVRARREVAIKLMWIPGIRPVKVPARIPKSKGRIRFNILIYERHFFYYDLLFIFVNVWFSLEFYLIALF